MMILLLLLPPLTTTTTTTTTTTINTGHVTRPISGDPKALAYKNDKHRANSQHNSTINRNLNLHKSPRPDYGQCTYKEKWLLFQQNLSSLFETLPMCML